jgi:hypothetical protein
MRHLCAQQAEKEAASLKFFSNFSLGFYEEIFLFRKMTAAKVRALKKQWRQMMKKGWN